MNGVEKHFRGKITDLRWIEIRPAGGVFFLCFGRGEKINEMLTN